MSTTDTSSFKDRCGIACLRGTLRRADVAGFNGAEGGDGAPKDIRTGVEERTGVPVDGDPFCKPLDSLGAFDSFKPLDAWDSLDSLDAFDSFDVFPLFTSLASLAPFDAFDLFPSPIVRRTLSGEGDRVEELSAGVIMISGTCRLPDSEWMLPLSTAGCVSIYSAKLRSLPKMEIILATNQKRAR